MSLRERVVFPIEKLSLYLTDILAHENIREAVILSTCNPLRIILRRGLQGGSCSTGFCLQHLLSREELHSALYVYQGEQAVEHIMQVACGLDSMVLGESQILGQMKAAFSESCAAGAVRPRYSIVYFSKYSQ